ncbi:MAG: bifunctional nuclease family protein [Candidatus Margulisbacteria bacterium]|nr:bifunctional nuclease family protein [Candidatus Margulisiibacteriota bacterium]MBU1021729.1 bifunctional nuclease family protein [Candidatus Margulisiibacteriota bacterium]MBU1729475.1 bifunctional nuclease family protein [Candidatus Margulisiibacteriota bacterium]MBU1955424.1 bifunctional nuclease family protein [Candidatus Margulisiibacteriota bacterium]
MIQMQIGGLGFDPKNLSPLVLLKDQEELNFLPIWIGIFEAAAIAMELQNVTPPRPMTHDLIKETIKAFDAKIERVVISDVKEGTFYAIIEIKDKAGKIIELDSRPSDAIALAVRTKCPINVAEIVMMQAKLVNAEKDEEETKKFKDFINNMKPEDFTKYYKKD